MDNDDFGHGDATYRAAGEEAGIRRLVDSFYDIMSSRTEYQRIYSWHPPDNQMSRDKLARFLCAWTGGPQLYARKYGTINIPASHAHLKVTEVERDQWLHCMREALDEQAYTEQLKSYLLKQLRIPAERIRQTCQGH